MKSTLVAVLLFVSVLCFAAPPKAPEATPAIAVPTASNLSADAKLRIFFYSEKLSREQISLNQFQNLSKDAQQRTQNAFLAYQQVVAEEVKKAGLPEGTQVWPSLDTNDFVITPPEKKPEEKKADAPVTVGPPVVTTPVKK